MKLPFYLILIVFLTACGIHTSEKKANEVQIKSREISSEIKTNIPEETEEETDTTDYDSAIYFIVVADTSLDYNLLHKKMIGLNRQLNIPIDTLGRLYNKSKNLIALPENDEDEMYAGEYFGRRFPSNNLSLEYLNFYQKQAKEKTIALVAGIYENENSADSAIAFLKQPEKKAFKIKADIYIGCMH